MTTTQKEILAKTAAITKLNTEDMSQENSVTTTNKTSSGSPPRSVSPGTNKPAVRGIEDIWKEATPTTTTQPGAERRRNGSNSAMFNSC